MNNKSPEPVTIHLADEPLVRLYRWEKWLLAILLLIPALIGVILLVSGSSGLRLNGASTMTITRIIAGLLLFVSSIYLQGRIFAKSNMLVTLQWLKNNVIPFPQKGDRK